MIMIGGLRPRLCTHTHIQYCFKQIGDIVVLMGSCRDGSLKS